MKKKKEEEQILELVPGRHEGESAGCQSISGNIGEVYTCDNNIDFPF